MRFGYKLSSEEHGANDLVRYARRAEAIGLDFCAISDHYHPWIDRQGHSPFVWSILGALSQATSKIELFTAVTCPTMRMHPAIVAHAVATTAALLPGRFAFGVGTGEALNEHILGADFPNSDIRLKMLEEALEVMRRLWQGEMVNHDGAYFTVESARIYTLPEEPPKVYIAATGMSAAKAAGRIGNGFIAPVADPSAVKQFREAGGEGKPAQAELHTCWAKDAAEAKKTAKEWWPNVAIEGLVLPELRIPAHFEEIAKLTSEDAVAAKVVTGPDPQPYLDKVQEYEDAGLDGLWFHQIGPDQDGFFDFLEKTLLPRLR